MSRHQGRPRVLHVINQLSGGGAEASLLQLLPHLQGRHDHAIAVLRSEAAGVHRPEAIPVPVFAPGSTRPGRVAALRHVHGVIRSYRPDLVHTTLFEADLIGRTAARLTSTPAMTSLVNAHTPHDLARDAPVAAVKVRGAQTVDRLLARRATTAFHAITEAVAVSAVEQLGIDRARIHVVPRGRDAAALGEATPERRLRVRRALGLPLDAPVVLNVAREEPQKGQRYLLEALARLRQRRTAARLVIAGRTGRSTADLDQRVAQLALTGAVTRLGFRTDVGDLLSAADVLVMPSLYEGLGGSLLEGMAVGIPIVASDVPAMAEVLQEGRCGVLVPVGDPIALAAGIEQVLANPDDAAQLRRTAHERFRACYTLQAAAQGMAAMYERILEQQR